MRRPRNPFGRRERGSWVTTDLLRELSRFPEEAQLLLLYARSLARRSLFYPGTKRLAKVMGETEAWVAAAEDKAAECGLLTDQWLGYRNLLDGGRRFYLTVQALNGMRDRGLSIADRLVAVRLLAYADADGRIRTCTTDLADRLGMQMRSLDHAIRRLRRAQVLSRDLGFALYVR